MPVSYSYDGSPITKIASPDATTAGMVFNDYSDSCMVAICFGWYGLQVDGGGQ